LFIHRFSKKIFKNAAKSSNYKFEAKFRDLNSKFLKVIHSLVAFVLKGQKLEKTERGEQVKFALKQTILARKLWTRRRDD